MTTTNAKKQADLLRKFLDHFPGAAYLKDQDLRVLMANAAFLPMFGIDPERMIGRSNVELFPGEFGEKISADDRRVLASGETIVIEEEFAGRHFETTKFVVTENDTRYLGGITVDVTQRHRAEQDVREHLAELTELNHKLEQAQNQLLQSEKMASIGQLAAGVAHELNNPIGFVQSNIGTLERYVDDLLAVVERCRQFADGCADADHADNIRRIIADHDVEFIAGDIHQLLAESRDGTDRVRRIVQNLKDFSHVSEEEWQWSDLHRGLESTLNIAWNEIKYKAEVERRYGTLPQVHCLAAQINQVFLNLLVNAAQAIETSGKIVITTGSGDGRVWVEITDNGKGIPPENLQRVFDPFFTTKPVGKGTGLGLSLAWSIARKHDGDLSVRSTPGAGTTFRLELPIDGKPAATAKNHGAPPGC